MRTYSKNITHTLYYMCILIFQMFFHILRHKKLEIFIASQILSRIIIDYLKFAQGIEEASKIDFFSDSSMLKK